MKIKSCWTVMFIINSHPCLHRKQEASVSSIVYSKEMQCATHVRSPLSGTRAESRQLLTASRHRPRGSLQAKATDSMSEQKVVFQNTAQLKLVGVFTDAGSPNVVILCHGYAGSKDGFCYPKMAKALAAKKLSSLRFDFTGNGESEGAFEFGNYWNEVGDLRCAVQYVQTVLGKKVVAIVGHSKGGDVVLLYASKYDDIPFVVNIAGRFDMKRGIKERFGEEVMSQLDKTGEVPMTIKTEAGTVKWLLTKKSMEERKNLDMEAAAKAISISEVLTVHGTADAVIPYQDGETFAKCIRQHELYLIQEADHNFRKPGAADELINKTVQFILQGL